MPTATDSSSVAHQALDWKKTVDSDDAGSIGLFGDPNPECLRTPLIIGTALMGSWDGSWPRVG
jgi:hypothetical protein